MEGADFERFKTRVETMPFHTLIGLELVAATDEGLIARVTMRDELMGNRTQRIMHGGVIATVLDAVCGYLSGVVATRRLLAAGDPDAMVRINRIATIDLRVDYIRPLKSTSYTATSSVVHPGSTIIRTRGEVRNADDELVAAALANYSY